MNLFKRLFSKKHKHSKLNTAENSIINNNNESPNEYSYFSTSNIYKFNEQIIDNEIYVVTDDEFLSLANDCNTTISSGKQLLVDKLSVDQPSTGTVVVEPLEQGNNPSLQTKQNKINKIQENVEQINQISIDGDDYVNVNESEYTNDIVLPEKNKYTSDFNKTNYNPNTLTGVEDILNMIMKELNKIILEREDLKKQILLKTNSYKSIKRKLNTLLTNRFYKPIRLY